MIEIKNLVVNIAGKDILKGINLPIQNGKTLVIAGKSGSGKSVLVKTIVGLIHPKSGSIITDGDDIRSCNSPGEFLLKKRISMLFQSAALFDSMNVFQNIAFPLYEHSKLSLPVIKQKVSKSLQMVGLEGTGELMPSELSGGMKKRVGLARAVITSPEYIIYDEPTTGLDPVISAEIVNLMLRLKKELNHTPIVITHDLECIDRIAEDVFMLQDGKPIFYGSYKDFKESPNPIINKFLKVYCNAKNTAS